MSVQSVCRWLRSKSYGNIWKVNIHVVVISVACIHVLLIFVSDENIDAAAVERLMKSADDGFAILWAICGIGVKANSEIDGGSEEAGIYLFSSYTPAQ